MFTKVGPSLREHASWLPLAAGPNLLPSLYRVTMVVAVVGMGWIDLDLGCSTILPSYLANSAKPRPKTGRN